MSLYIAVYIQKSECIQAQSQEIEQCVERQKDVTVSREAGAVYSIDKDEHQYVKDVCGWGCSLTLTGLIFSFVFFLIAGLVSTA